MAAHHRAPAGDRVKALLRFTAWATLAFVAAWFVAHPYQRALAGLAGRIVAPPGTEI